MVGHPQSIFHVVVAAQFLQANDLEILVMGHLQVALDLLRSHPEKGYSQWGIENNEQPYFQWFSDKPKTSKIHEYFRYQYIATRKKIEQLKSH